MRTGRAYGVAAWTRFARERGLVFVPASGPWYALGAQSMRGSVREVAVDIETSRGAHHQPQTRVRARAVDSTEHTLVAFDDDPSVTPVAVEGGLRVVTGEVEFDLRFVVVAARAEAVGLLDDGVRAAMKRARQRLAFVYDAGAVSVTWPAEETDPDRLADALDIVVAACRHRGSGAYR